ncbi:MAG TPA: c-type cytochrome [Candidatus Brocadiales bacterium]|nr:c-type cytochrome [Candidatus Brocadiales bacterium]
MVKKLIKTSKKTVLIFMTVLTGFVGFSITLSCAETKTDNVITAATEKLYNPYKRVKNGPPLKNVTHKVNASWISGWIKDTKIYDPGARMPFLMLEDDEVKAIVAYLASIADKNPPYPKPQWDDYILKPESELTVEESDNLDKLISTGKGAWGKARCGLCHALKGIGGFVPVAPDLGKVQLKISNRDWLYYWIKNPREHFLDTMMSQFRLTDEELMPLIEYIVRSEDFKPEYEEDEEEAVIKPASPMAEEYSKDPAMIEKGKKLVTISRCVVCHDIEGINEVLPPIVRDPVPTEGFPKLVYEIRCLTCHNFRGEGGTYAPPWDIVGSKLKEDWMRNFLKSPDVIRPILQQMPRFGITEEEAEVAVSHIKTNYTMPTFGLTEKEVNIATEFIKKEFVAKEIPDLFKEVDEKRAAAGEKFFNDYGCNTCHAIGPVGGVIGPNLTKVGDRLEPNYIYWHLKNPNHAALDTVEPHYKLTDEEIANLVHFMMSCTAKGTS